MLIPMPIPMMGEGVSGGPWGTMVLLVVVLVVAVPVVF